MNIEEENLVHNLRERIEKLEAELVVERNHAARCEEALDRMDAALANA